MENSVRYHVPALLIISWNNFKAMVNDLINIEKLCLKAPTNRLFKCILYKQQHIFINFTKLYYSVWKVQFDHMCRTMPMPHFETTRPITVQEGDKPVKEARNKPSKEERNKPLKVIYSNG